MTFLGTFDFNHKTGYGSVILVSIGVSLLFFAAAYLFEGLSWLSAYKEEANDLFLDVGWNWIRGSGLAFFMALVSLGVSAVLLKRNRKLPQSPPLFGKLDLNKPKGVLGVVFLSVSFVFFFNGGLYRIEAARWFYAGLQPGRVWFLDQASQWIAASSVMFLIGILLSAAGWVFVVTQWKRRSD